MAMSYAEAQDWLQSTWCSINGGGIVTSDQVIEMKSLVMVKMLNGELSWDHGQSARQVADEMNVVVSTKDS